MATVPTEVLVPQGIPLSEYGGNSSSVEGSAGDGEDEAALLVIALLLAALLLCGLLCLSMYLWLRRSSHDVIWEHSKPEKMAKHATYDFENTSTLLQSRSVTFVDQRGSSMLQTSTIPQERHTKQKADEEMVPSAQQHPLHNPIPFSHLQTSIVRACHIIKQKSPTIFAKIPRNFEVGEKIGSGSNGVVHKAFKKDGSCFAIKTISVCKEGNPDSCARLMKEVNIMVQLRNDYVIHFMGCKYDKLRNSLNIFMEYAAGGSLGELCRAQLLTEAKSKEYLHDVLQGIRFLHSKGVIHRDIKGDNILLTSTGRAKISDFGACKELEATSQAGTMIGTPLWMAPEAIVGEYCFGSDIWSVGCVVVEMLNEGVPPWEPFRNHWQAMLVIGQWKKELPPCIPDNLSTLCIDFLKRCFTPSTGERATPVMLLSHPFMRRGGSVECDVTNFLGGTGGSLVEIGGTGGGGGGGVGGGGGGGGGGLAGSYAGSALSGGGGLGAVGGSSEYLGLGLGGGSVYGGGCVPTSSLLATSAHSSPVLLDTGPPTANASLIQSSTTTSAHNSGNSNGPLLSVTTTASPLYTPPRLTPVSPVSLL